LGKDELEELETFLDIPSLTTNPLEDLISKGKVKIQGGGNSNIFGIFTPNFGEMIQFDYPP